MEKLDLKKIHRQLFNPSAREVVEVVVPPFNYLMIDGEGAPEGELYAQAMATLYPLAYTLKFQLKPTQDFVVGPLEGLWWDDTPNGFNAEDKDGWKWTSMIIQPDFVTAEHFATACDTVREKGQDAPLLDRIRLEILDEGRCVQIMHVGPYADEGPTIERLHSYIAQHGMTFRGHHHEIYLSDPRRTAPEKLRTVIRQPVDR